VRYLPQTGSLFSAIGLPVNLRQLAFEGVHVSTETDTGVAMVSIDGKIVSKSAKPVHMPRLRFAARNAQGREIYTWTARPERSTLAAGKTLRQAAGRNRRRDGPLFQRTGCVRGDVTSAAHPVGLISLWWPSGS
jgi:hypothetical protein